MFGAYGFGQGYFADGPAGTGILELAPPELISLTANIRTHIDVNAQVRRTVNASTLIRRRIDVKVER